MRLRAKSSVGPGSLGGNSLERFASELNNFIGKNARAYSGALTRLGLQTLLEDWLKICEFNLLLAARKSLSVWGLTPERKPPVIPDRNGLRSAL